MIKKKLKTIGTANKDRLMILPNGETVSLDTWETRRNNNVLCYGGSGAGKTRSVVTTNLLAAVESSIVADTKGNLYNKWSDCFRKQGYRVVHLNFIHPEESDRYDPLAYVHSQNDAQKLAHQIVFSGNSMPSGSLADPFWDNSSELLLLAIIAYIMEGKTIGNNGTFCDIPRLIAQIRPAAWEDKEDCEFDETFKKHRTEFIRITQHDSWAYRQYCKFRTTPPRTMGCILITLQTILRCFDTKEIREMMSADDVDFPSIGQKKTVVFVEISDTDRSKDTLANIFYSQAMNQLCTYADEKCKDSRLPVPVRFILDDFGTNCRIDGFENMISNIRSREISVMMMLQSNGQLKSSYGDSAHTIIDNCDTIIYLGGNDIETAQMISTRCNKPLDAVLNMPIGTNWVIRRGETPRFSQTVDLNEYDTGKYENPTEKQRNHTETPAAEQLVFS